MARIISLSLCAALLVTGSGRAQVSPDVPPTAIETARRVATQLGRAAVGPPAIADVARTSPLTGQRVFQVVWPGSGTLEVDEASGRVVEFRDLRTKDQAPVAPAQAALTRDQAEAAARLVISRGEFPPGDWRVTKGLYVPDLPDPLTLRPLWAVALHRYHEETICELDDVVVYVDAHDGRVDRYVLEATGVRLPPSGPILAEAQARAVAVAAFQAGGGAANAVPQMVWLTWAWLEAPSAAPRCRPAYWYRFYIERTFPDGSAAPALQVDARVDAVTGELWYIQGITEGPDGFDANRVKRGLRWALAQRLLEEPRTAGLGRALLASGRITARKPGRGAVRFLEMVGGKRMEFAVEVRTRRLGWRAGKGAWQGAVLPRPEFQRLLAWQRRRQSRK